ncbi:hypothetical protein L6164_026807 [Bauhinia variegata]|uniref:Uncharacterized protein n=1 Tax=Bauhinia variegata TaxID=167791 RepID=A0ACB9LRB3_BAUVA|nr:hypothetical protein L6164_026807 [Bauhinia variegata]
MADQDSAPRESKREKRVLTPDNPLSEAASSKRRAPQNPVQRTTVEPLFPAEGHQETIVQHTPSGARGQSQTHDEHRSRNAGRTPSLPPPLAIGPPSLPAIPHQQSPSPVAGRNPASAGRQRTNNPSSEKRALPAIQQPSPVASRNPASTGRQRTNNPSFEKRALPAIQQPSPVAGRNPASAGRQRTNCPNLRGPYAALPPPPPGFGLNTNTLPLFTVPEQPVYPYRAAAGTFIPLINLQQNPHLNISLNLNLIPDRNAGMHGHSGYSIQTAQQEQEEPPIGGEDSDPAEDVAVVIASAGVVAAAEWTVVA